jgi:hypothetical protein
MKLTLDVENTVTHRDGKMHLDPFEPTNSLTMVGVLTDQLTTKSILVGVTIVIVYNGF